MSTSNAHHQLLVSPHFNSFTHSQITITNSIPKEEQVYEIVFSYFRDIDLRAHASVCKKWNQISMDYLKKADDQACLKIRESAKFFSETFGFQVESEDEDDDLFGNRPTVDDNPINLEQQDLIHQMETLSKIAKQPDQGSDQKESSFALRKKVLDVLTHLNKNAFASLQFQTIANRNHHASYLLNLAKNYQDFEFYNHSTTDVSKTNKFYEICLQLIKEADFNKALEVASKIKMESEDLTQRQYAQTQQKLALGQIAKALTQKGYLDQALRIATHDIYSGQAIENFDNAVVLKLIFEELRTMGFFGRMQEIINQIPNHYPQVKTDFLRVLIRAFIENNRLEEAIQSMLTVPPPHSSTFVEELNSIATKFFERKDFNSAEAVARQTKNYSLLAKIALASEQTNDEKKIKMILDTPEEEKAEFFKCIIMIEGKDKMKNARGRDKE